jgi:hypothetical protein
MFRKACRRYGTPSEKIAEKSASSLTYLRSTRRKPEVFVRMYLDDEQTLSQGQDRSFARW